MGFYSVKERTVSADEWNEVFQKAKECRFISYSKPDLSKSDNQLKKIAYVVIKMVKIELIVWYPKEKTIRYICYLDNRDIIDGYNGLEVYRVFARYHKVPQISNIDEVRENFSASPLVDFNSQFSGIRQEAWGYDLNSAYSSAMLHIWIDTSKPPRVKQIEEGEIGFCINDDGKLALQRKGFCYLVFDLMETPQGVKDFIKTHYERKKNAKTPEEKQKEKDMLNYTVGYLQRKNPYLRAAIVCYCNEYIENLIDENTLFWNTDSIVSRVRRPDLEENLGKEIGQWKIEHEGVVAYKGNAYQWNDDLPSYRGVPKTWFPNGFDILVDDLPKVGNTYYFDEEAEILKKHKEFECNE